MATTRPAQIKNLVVSAINKAHKQKQATGKLKQAWRLAAGKKAAQHSRPQKITKKTLTVTVDSPVWIYYLHNNKQNIEREINNQLQTQHNIKIRLRAGEHGGHQTHAKTEKTNNKKR